MPGKVLMVAYYFPPLGGPGVYRPLKFAKYLPEFGWKPHVVTIFDDPLYVHDFTLLEQISPDLAIERIRVSWDFDRLAAALKRIRGGWRLTDLLRYMAIPDNKVSWVLPAYRRSLAVIRKHGIDAIYTTSSPYSNHLIGFLLKRRTGLPWVADFRDEWARNNVYEPRPTRLHDRIHEKLEQLVVSTADHVISVSDPLSEMLRGSLRDRGKFSTITNGFDQSDLTAARHCASAREDHAFRLVYTGAFYGPRSPTHLIAAIHTLLNDGLISPDEIRVRLIGRVGKEHESTNPAWQRVVEYRGPVDHLTALAELQLADCLLLFVPSGPGAHGCPGKIFEYIASRKPILAMVPPEGVAAKIVRESATGVVVPPEDLGAIKGGLLDLFTNWKAGCLKVHPNESVILSYERRQLTKGLAGLLDQMCKSRSDRIQTKA